MKKFMLVGVLAILSLGASRCSDDTSPEGIAFTFYENLKEGNFSEIASLLAEPAFTEFKDPVLLESMRQEVGLREFRLGKVQRVSIQRLPNGSTQIISTLDAIELPATPFVQFTVSCNERWMRRASPSFPGATPQLDDHLFSSCRIIGMKKLVKN